MSRLTRWLTGALAASILVVGCGDSKPTNDTILITNDWVEASVPGRDSTPAYVTIRSDEPDVLTDVNVDGDIAEHAFLFQTHQGGDPSKYTSHVVEPGVDQRLFRRADREFKPLSQAEKDEGRHVPQAVNGGPRAEQIDEIQIDPRRPNADYRPQGGIPMHSYGYYIMLTGLRQPLVAGAPVQLELEFENADNLSVDTRVREQHPRASIPATRSQVSGKTYTVNYVDGRTDRISFKNRTFAASGCNRMSGRYSLRQGWLKLSRFSSTTAACVQPRGMKFDEELEALARYPGLAGIRGKKLIVGRRNDVSMVLTASGIR